MGKPSIGTVLLVPFPYADLSGMKTRPALVVANAELNCFIACQITSKVYSSTRTVGLLQKDFAYGGLPVSSFIRPDKLATIDDSLAIRSLGTITDQKFNQVKDALKKVFDL